METPPMTARACAHCLEPFEAECASVSGIFEFFSGLTCRRSKVVKATSASFARVLEFSPSVPRG